MDTASKNEKTRRDDPHLSFKCTAFSGENLKAKSHREVDSPGAATEAESAAGRARYAE
jgi:hypothetical protein